MNSESWARSVWKKKRNCGFHNSCQSWSWRPHECMTDLLSPDFNIRQTAGQQPLLLSSFDWIVICFFVFWPDFFQITMVSLEWLWQRGWNRIEIWYTWKLPNTSRDMTCDHFFWKIKILECPEVNGTLKTLLYSSFSRRGKMLQSHTWKKGL